MAEAVARPYTAGEPAPWFRAASADNPSFNFSALGGFYIVLTFAGSLQHAKAKAAHDFIRSTLLPQLGDHDFQFVITTVSESDVSSYRPEHSRRGLHYIWDTDQSVSRLYGAMSASAPADGTVQYRPFTLVLDPMLRVLHHIPLREAEEHNTQLQHTLNALPPRAQHAGVETAAPVLIVPRVLEPDFCRELIAAYQQQGGKESGFMREKDGRTIPILDPSFKRRKDFSFDYSEEHESLRAHLRAGLLLRLIPEIKKAYNFDVTRIERYIVACYDSEDKGFFRPHRDNTTKGTAHRRFACTINLNAEDYDGGELRFPEFGQRTYRAPTGGAVVFGCSLLHEATPVTRGTRYATLPFLYDDAAAKIRDENRQFLGEKKGDVA